MKTLSAKTKFAHLGKPGSIFTKGFQRRLDKIIQIVDLRNKTILDQGCGEGVWLEQFLKFTTPDRVYGSDIDNELIAEFKEQIKTQNSKLKTQNLKVCPAEKLDFADNTFDIVFSNEVLEHVVDDKKSVEEVLRVLKPGGKFIIFTPNRGWPFETHGMFFRGKYYWGNIPLLPWMPGFVRKKFAPHVRNYSNGDIRRLLSKSKSEALNPRSETNSNDQMFKFQIIHHSHVFPAFGKLSAKFGLPGRVVQKFFYALEKTPLHWFGISHFVVAEKVVE